MLTNLFFLWVIFHYALGGWETGRLLLTYFGLPVWIALAVVGTLVCTAVIIAPTFRFPSRGTR